MKYKLMTLLAASFTMVASGQETKEKTSKEETTGAKTTETTKKKDPVAKEPVKEALKEATKNVATSKVAISTAPVLKKFDGEKYAPTKLMGDPDYFIVYFTASW